MNDPSKRIDVNLSSLLSLKAELLRKHDEISKAKNTHLIDNFIPTRKTDKIPTKQNTVNSTKTELNNTEEYDDNELLQKSKKILQAKSILYDKMTKSGGSLNSDDNCLVLFNQKRQTAKQSLNYHSDSDSSEDEKYRKMNDDDENWVEYTDCLGRTRKCLKEDLEFFKKKDIDLAETVTQRNEQNPAEQQLWYEDTKGLEVSGGNVDSSKDDDNLSVISKTTKIDEMRSNWERQEEENIKKDYVHYQDILFDEARTHGVGFYQFSTDEVERTKQQRELEATRQRTLEAQKQKENFRKTRESIIVERVKAAKNRQRARLGLPPLEDEPEKTEQELYDKSAEIKGNGEEDKIKLKNEAEEKRREEERKQHIRPWDAGKNSSNKNTKSDEEWSYKPEKEAYTQEQWNEIKRNERNNEFAPIKNDYNRLNTNSTLFNNLGNNVESQARKKKTFTRRPMSNSESEDEKFNSEKHKKKTFTRRPISHYESDEEELNTEQRKRTEVPPPPTFDYYGPSQTKHRKTNRNHVPDLESSIAAGLKFLREQSDKGTLSTKMKWTSNADMK